MNAMNKKKLLTKILLLSLLTGLCPHTESLQTINATTKKSENFSAFSSSAGKKAVFSETTTPKNLPSRFDLRELGLVSAVKNQGDYGTCWAFSALASAETSLIRNFPYIDFSELHLSYFTFSGDENLEAPHNSEFSTAGGHTSISTSTLAQGIGPVSENILPYDTAPETIDHSLKHLNECKISDSYLLNSFTQQKVYADEVFNFTEEQIKELLMQENAVAVNFKYENSYNEKTFAQYMPSYSTPNHAVTIVGWDDDFSRENFLTPPERDGAWLVKNSWGSDWGDNGYFWISYCDKSLTDTNCIKAVPSDSYSSVYQHDTLAMTASVTADNEERNSAYMANVFTADTDEAITSVGLYTTDNNAEYEITVYTGLTDENSPVSGTPGVITKGTQKYAGYHTIKLDEAVRIKKGEKFSVVVKLTNPEHLYPIPVEASVILCENKLSMNVSEITEEKLDSSSDYGESFISSNGTRWTDTKGMKIEHAYENISLPDTNVVYYIGNVCLKAFGDNSDKVYFSQEYDKVAFGTKVELSSVCGQTIHYTTDGSIPDTDSPVYTEPIVIDKDMTVNAVTSDGENIYSRKYRQAEAVLSSVTVNDTLLDLGTYENINTDLSYNLEGTSEYVTLFPISTCDIEINGQKVISGHDSQKIKVSPGHNEIKIKCTEEGKKTTEYTLNVFKNYAAVDYYKEIIIFDEELTSVSSSDGHIFKNGESISEYFGQKLTVTTGDKITTLNVSEKTDLNEELKDAKISNSLEILTMLFSVSSKMVFSSSPDMSDAKSISERKYPILSENFFKVYPDYDTDLYFQIPATDDSPESTVYHITVPPRRVIPDEAVTIDITNENTISFTLENASELKAEYKIEIMTSEQAPYSTEILFPLKCTEDTTVITDLLPGETYMLYVHYKDNDNGFTPYVKNIQIKMPGQKTLCSFNYEQETIIFDENDLSVTTNDGKKLSCYDNISDYIGTSLTLTDSLGHTSSQFIPLRPEMEEINIDFSAGRLTGTFDDSIKYIRCKPNGLYYKAVSSENLSDRNGIIWLEDLFETGIMPGDRIYFYKEATNKKFSSLMTEIIVPDYPKINKKLLDVIRYTSTSILLKQVDGVEYGIRNNFRREFVWQDSPFFDDLTPGTQYILAVRYKSTSESMNSQATYNIITTLPEQNLKGDLDSNSKLTATDLVVMKKILFGTTAPDSYQHSVADINGDGKINIFDMKRLIDKFISEQI